MNEVGDSCLAVTNNNERAMQQEITQVSATQAEKQSLIQGRRKKKEKNKKKKKNKQTRKPASN